MNAAVLFADVSGFTPLTENLARRGPDGPERLTRLLNRYFSQVIALLEAEGGEVAEFSGDAVTVLFPAGDEPPGHAVRRAAQAAEALHLLLSRGDVTATSLGQVNLSLKISIGVGEVYAFLVGGVYGRWEYMIAGDPLRQVAEAEHQAQPGQTLLSPEAGAICHPDPLPPRPLAPLTIPDDVDPAAVAALLGYLPAAVRSWLSTDLQAWAAELRPMSILFIVISGVDYDRADSLSRVQECFHAIQATIYRYEGSINKLAVDDKGMVLLVLFGAPPLAHKDDPARAVGCALELQSVAHTYGLGLAIGVTTGSVFAGAVGSPTRREYTVMGDLVNLAARLMAAAGPGEIRCDQATAAGARRSLACEALPPVKLKGKAALVPVFRPLGPILSSPSDHTLLVGRATELRRIDQLCAQVRDGACRVLLLEGEAGIGKSCLVARLQHMVSAYAMRPLSGAGLSSERATPYRAWRAVLRAALDLPEGAALAAQRAQLLAWATDQAPDLVARLPLLNAVLPLDLPETALIAPLAAADRHALRVDLLISLLRRRAAGPLVVLLEDAHWLDSLSLALVLALARTLTAEGTPLLLVLSLRPQPGADMPADLASLAALPCAERLALGPLSDADLAALIAARLDIPLPALPAALAQLVQARAEGNPFFAEELVLALRDQGRIRVVGAEGGARCELLVPAAELDLALPATLHGVALARIDQLLPEAQLTLKVGAVIGRSFAYLPLHTVLARALTLTEPALLGWLTTLVQRDLTRPAVEVVELSYFFRHSIIREVAYSTLLYAQRRHLHREVAEWYAQSRGLADGGDLAPLLAYHWEMAEEPAQAVPYLIAAGDQALAASGLREARAYFERTLALLGAAGAEAQRAGLLRRLGVALWSAGELDAARARLEESVRLARDAGATAQLLDSLSYLGRALTDMGDYPAAQAALEEALALARAAQNPADLARVLRYLGWVILINGEHDRARETLRTSLEQARLANDHYAEANAVLNLGNVELSVAQFDQAAIWYRTSLAIARDLGDQWLVAIVLANLGELAARQGDLALAGDMARQSLAIDRAIGNRNGMALTLGNLGEVTCALGEIAESARCFHEALTLSLAGGGTLNPLYTFCGIARLQLRVGATDAAGQLLALVLAHPSANDDLRAQARRLLDDLGSPRPADRPSLEEAAASAGRWLAALT